MNRLTLVDHILIIKDPRQNWKVAHKLSDIIFLAIAESWE